MNAYMMAAGCYVLTAALFYWIVRRGAQEEDHTNE